MIKIMKFNEVSKEEIFARPEGISDVGDIVAEIIDDVKANGDAALYKYTEKFDKAKLLSLELSDDEVKEAMEKIPSKLLEVLLKAAENIRAFHTMQLRDGFKLEQDNGVVLGQKIMPVEKAGLYVPGGTAAYPSTVLMDAIPAKIAGVKELVITTPCGPDGKIPYAIVAAAKIAGVDRIFKIGGAQAIAALAYGTESVPKVDKIVGPGNAFVAEAKRRVYGAVSIDMIAGPSEILVLADSKSNPRHLAADMLSQAEHDKLASAVLVCDSESLAKAVAEEIEIQIKKLAREEIARASIDNNGKIIIASDLLEAVEVANEIAPEHLELVVDNPFELLDKVRNAGSVFLGRYCPEALGDYMAGPNHTLPTGGSARFSSPLSVDDFIKKTQFLYYTKDALSKLADDVAYFAETEGLTGHAASALVRGKE